MKHCGDLNHGRPRVSGVRRASLHVAREPSLESCAFIGEVLGPQNVGKSLRCPADGHPYRLCLKQWSYHFRFCYTGRMNKPEEKYMRLAIEAAVQSAKNGDYGHGAVIVKNGEVISTGYETLKSANDPVNGHAEIDAIRKACQAFSGLICKTASCTVLLNHVQCVCRQLFGQRWIALPTLLHVMT